MTRTKAFETLLHGYHVRPTHPLKLRREKKNILNVNLTLSVYADFSTAMESKKLHRLNCTPVTRRYPRCIPLFLCPCQRIVMKYTRGSHAVVALWSIPSVAVHSSTASSYHFIVDNTIFKNNSHYCFYMHFSLTHQVIYVCTWKSYDGVLTFLFFHVIPQ